LVGRLTGCELDAEPHAHRHDSVVNDMQGGYLIVFLAHNEKELNNHTQKQPLIFDMIGFPIVDREAYSLTVSKNSVNLEK